MGVEKVAVIGAGVIGLRSALLLAQKGLSVTIFTACAPHETTSVAAGAIWMPYQVFPESKALNWARRSLELYRVLALDSETGVLFRNHTEFFPEKVARPAWMDLAEPSDAYDCQAPSDAVCSYSVKIPVIDTYKFIQYHLSLLEEYRVPIVYRAISDFRVLSDYQYIVNAAGVGSAVLAADSSVYPVKGQTFVLSQPSKPLTQSIFYQTDSLKTLIVPHVDKVVVGITYNEHDLSSDYDFNKEKELFESACSFYPRLKETSVLMRRVGYRPARSEVRLEREAMDDQIIFHNYGHGGAGVALALGCAEALVQLV